MERRYNGRNLNFNSIYSKITKYRSTIQELASEYGMDEEAFKEKMEKGLDPKLYTAAIKANEKNMKKHHDNKTTSNGEENEMAAKNEAKKDADYRKKQSEKDKENNQRKARTTRNSKVAVPTIDSLENQKATLMSKISEKEKALNEANEILGIREEALTETQHVFDEAKKALERAKSERDAAAKVVTQQTKALETDKTQLKGIEEQITELKRKAIYLVAPGYKGEKPAFGKFYSTVSVEGFGEISICEPHKEYAIEPELKDMLVAGYDSYKEYMCGLRFVMLCAEFTYNDKEYTVLVSDECQKKLLKAHVG